MSAQGLGVGEGQADLAGPPLPVWVQVVHALEVAQQMLAALLHPGELGDLRPSARTWDAVTALGVQRGGDYARVDEGCYGIETTLSPGAS